MKYEVIQRKSLMDLMVLVNQQIQRGWEPLGGVSFVPITNGYGATVDEYSSGYHSGYIQAMIKRDDQ